MDKSINKFTSSIKEAEELRASLFRRNEPYKIVREIETPPTQGNYSRPKLNESL